MVANAANVKATGMPTGGFSVFFTYHQKVATAGGITAKTISSVRSLYRGLRIFYAATRARGRLAAGWSPIRYSLLGLLGFPLGGPIQPVTHPFRQWQSAPLG